MSKSLKWFIAFFIGFMISIMMFIFNFNFEQHMFKNKWVGVFTIVPFVFTLCAMKWGEEAEAAEGRRSQTTQQ